ncbi:hypothetical protein KW803_01070 [Candidatus Saccharibacteria bacterium]|nr:hypothetical protein [Candidatus Saccharibacteria bacterium]
MQGPEQEQPSIDITETETLQIIPTNEVAANVAHTPREIGAIVMTQAEFRAASRVDGHSRSAVFPADSRSQQ